MQTKTTHTMNQKIRLVDFLRQHQLRYAAGKFSASQVAEDAARSLSFPVTPGHLRHLMGPGDDFPVRHTWSSITPGVLAANAHNKDLRFLASVVYRLHNEIGPLPAKSSLTPDELTRLNTLAGTS